MSWIPQINPIIVYSTLGVVFLLALGFGVYLYLFLKVELGLLKKRGMTRAEFDARLAELVAEMEALRSRLAAAESRAQQQEWTPPQAVNLNRRGQILRLYEKGRSIADIASDLQISQGEVELLVKVHDWSATSPL
jgi:DNA-binding NarL/FixJ family response regulator